MWVHPNGEFMILIKPKMSINRVPGVLISVTGNLENEFDRISHRAIAQAPSLGKITAGEPIHMEMGINKSQL